MNPTLGYLYHRAYSAWSTRPGAIRALVQSDLRGAPPPLGELFPGQRALAARAGGPAGTLPYYLPQTLLALALAVTFGIAAWLVAASSEPGVWTRGAVLALALGAALALWQALGHRFGPPLIDQQRLADARAALERSGDGQARPLGVGVLTVIAIVFAMDGWLAAFSIVSEAAGAILSPKLAMGAALACSALTSFLLFELTSFAAREQALNRRRHMVRALLGSKEPAEQERAKAIISSVGAQLDYDFSRAATRTRARWTLSVLVIALSVAVFTVRINTEHLAAAETPPETEEPWPQR